MKALTALFIVLMLILGFWLTFKAPCGVFKYAPAREIPGRCLMDNR